MTQQKINELREYLKNNYMREGFTTEKIAEEWGMHERTIRRYVSELGLKKPRKKQIKPNITRVNAFIADAPKYEIPAGAYKTANGYAVKVGVRTIHTMAG